MAEILGIVSSGAGLASLSGQLLASVQTLKGFSQVYRNAPKLLETLSFDLETLSMMLREVETYRQQRDEPIDEVFERCTFRLQSEVQIIKSYVNKLCERLQKSRVRGKLWTAFEDPEIQKALNGLERAKSMLWPTLQMYIDRRRARDDQEHRQAILARLDRLPFAEQRTADVVEYKLIYEDYTSISRARILPATERGVHDASKTDDLRSARSSLDSQPAESRMPKNTKRRLLVKFPTWLSRRVWSIGMLQASWGFDWSLHTWMRHSTSPAFDYCRQGNLLALRNSIANGEVGPRDRFRGCFSLLELAAMHGHIDICNFLMNRCRLAMDIEALDGALRVLVFNIHNWEHSFEQYHAIFRFFLERSTVEYDIDGSLVEIDAIPGWWLACPDAEILCHALRSHLVLTPIKQVFEPHQVLDIPHAHAYRLGSPDVLLWLFAIEWSTLSFIKLSLDVKEHVLHLTSGKLGSMIPMRDRQRGNYPTSLLFARWLALARDLILAGANPVQLVDGMTALVRLSTNVGLFSHLISDTQETIFSRLYITLQMWLSAIQGAGIDLIDYSELEREAWNHTIYRDESSRCWHSNFCTSVFHHLGFEIHDLIWGPSPSDWSFAVRLTKTVAVWKRCPVPGSWKECSTSFPMNARESLHNDLKQAGWLKLRTISVSSPPIDVRQFPGFVERKLSRYLWATETIGNEANVAKQV